jgi:predicted component of type VI protein secretion system
MCAGHSCPRRQGPVHVARVARDAPDGRINAERTVPELTLSLRERELAKFSIVAARTTIGRDPGCDLVIDNGGISRLHAAIELVGSGFVLRDCDSENGVTLNGEPCREGCLADGDMIGLNKFLIRFSHQALEVPAHLPPQSAKAQAALPRDVQRTMHVDADAAQALVDLAKQQIARQRAEKAAGAAEPSVPRSLPERPRSPEPLRWEEPDGAGPSLALVVGAVVVGGALIAGLLAFVR